MIKTYWPVAIILFILTVVLFGYTKKVDSNTNVLQVKIDKGIEENNNLKNRLAELEAGRTKAQTDIQKYILSYYKTVCPTVAREIAKNILIAGERHDVPFASIVAVMEVESQFNPTARSSKGARGLMQVMPNIWMNELNLKSKYDFHNIQIGIDSGAYILRKYLGKTDNNMEKALYKYVGGSTDYVKRVYECMGKFVVYKSFANMTVQEEPVPIQDFDVQLKKENFVHTVTHRGETYSIISKWYTKDMNNWKTISQLNASIDPLKIQIGDKIIIPYQMVKRTTKLMKEYIVNGGLES